MTDIEYLKKYLKPEELAGGLEKLNQGIPVQYIVGNVDFYGINFEVNNKVLIPRFETEELIEKTIKYINLIFNGKISVLDIGTGSGCIAVTLKKKLSNIEMDAIDISLDALEVAQKNALLNEIDISFFQSDVYSNIIKKYDVIISNPPYISPDEDIMDIVKNNEPQTALYARNNGLYYYEQIIKEALFHLNDKFLLAFEIGKDQGTAIIEIINKYIPNCEVSLEQDLQKRDRFIFVFNKNSF